MAIVYLPIVDLGNLNGQGQFVQQKSITGGLFMLVFTPPSHLPFRVTGFVGAMTPVTGVGFPTTTYVDGRVRLPFQITVPPNFISLMKGDLELLFIRSTVYANADLQGFVYGNVSQLYVMMNLPNTVQFTMSTNTANLIIETLE